MTEQEWLESRDPWTMLGFLAYSVGAAFEEFSDPHPMPLTLGGRGHLLPCVCCRTRCYRGDGLCPAYRKLRLFACACCRRTLPLLPDLVCRLAIEATEQYVDATLEETAWLDVAHVFDDKRRRRFPKASPTPDDGAWNAVYCATHRRWQARLDEEFARDRWRIAVRVAEDAADSIGLGEGGIQAIFLRDILGNPFRTIVLAPNWQTPIVLALATAAYEDRELPAGILDPDRLAVLADALEEAGAEGGLIKHLRCPRPHIRGCWVIDLLTQRE